MNEWCQQCGVKRLAYRGARFCGAGCAARHEAHELPSDQARAFVELNETTAMLEQVDAVLKKWTPHLPGGTNSVAWDLAEDVRHALQGAAHLLRFQMNDHVRRLLEVGQLRCGCCICFPHLLMIQHYDP